MKKVVLLTCMFLIPLTLASETQRRFRVFVNVIESKNADVYDTYIKEFLEVRLKKEFYLLQDVDVVDVDQVRFGADWDFVLSICYLQHVFFDGDKTGQISLANDLSERVPRSYFKDNLYPVRDRAPVYATHLGISLYSRESLDEYCIWLVGGIDKEVFTPIRELLR